GVRGLCVRGDGSFRTARAFPAGGSYSRSVAVAVFAVPARRASDVAVANYDGGVSVLLGNGDGSFQTARDFPAGRYPSSVAVGDFDGDDHLDLAAANNVISGVMVLVGNGDGSFNTARDFPACGGSVA